MYDSASFKLGRGDAPSARLRLIVRSNNDAGRVGLLMKGRLMFVVEVEAVRFVKF